MNNKVFFRVVLIIFAATALIALMGLFTRVVKAQSYYCTGRDRGCKTTITSSWCSSGGGCGGRGCGQYGCGCVWNSYEKIWECGTCRCSSSCVETYSKSCQVSGGSCRADGCGSGTCGSTAPNCYWACSRQCSGKECGDDGCGGSCGSCGGGQTCQSGQCVAGCNATAPSNLAVARTSPTTSTLSWTPGANGNSQRVYVGSDKNAVQANCTSGPACVVSVAGLPTSQSSYGVAGLSASTVYYYRVVNYKDAGCSTPSATKASVSSCEITNSEPVSIQPGSTATIISSANSSTDLTSVDFASGDTGIVTVNPASDTTSPYRTIASGVAGGTTTVRADVMIAGAVDCTDSVNVEVGAAQAWWQVMDADVTAGGDIISPIPASCTLPVCNPVFNLKGGGGFPGVPVYGGATADFEAGSGTGTVAEPPYSWLVNSSYSASKIYDYSYFERQIPTDVVFTEIATPTYNGGDFNSGGAPSRGYVWYHYDGATYGDLTISGNVNLTGNRKVVLLVDGADLYVTGLVNLNSPGQGYFMAVVGKDSNGLKGNIIVDPGVSHPLQPAMEGIFLAEGEFRTGTGTNRFYFRGAIASYGGIVLERDLDADNEDTPAELFEYSPAIMATFPQVFTTRRLRWKEVAP